MSHVIGIDGGTESLRAFVFDMEGRPKGTAATPYKTDFPNPGWAEQSPEDWWAALGKSVKGALADAGLTGDDIVALSVDTTSCSVVALDEQARPLRSAMIWMDVRAAEEADAVAATGDDALRVNGAGSSPVSAEWMLPKALWLKRHQADIFGQAAFVGEYQDYINLRLTDRWVGSLNNMSIRWHYQNDHGGVPHSLLEKLGLASLAAKWPQDVLAPGEIVGGLTSEAAAHMGLPAELPVVQGGADAFIGMIGLGVTQPGEMALITGSSHLQLGLSHSPLHKPGMWGSYMDAVYPQKAVLEGGQTSSGSVIAWFKRHFAPDISYETLNAEAAKLPPGSEGLLVLDHFQGNRTPYTDALSRGAITGLSLRHTPAHVFRAIIEGVCLGSRLIVDNFGDDYDASRIVVCGGATNSPFWLQIHANTLGAPLELTEVPDAPALGCAILAAHGIGAYPSIEEGCKAMVRTTSTITPDPDEAAAYQTIMPKYRALYEAMKTVRETA